MKSRVLLVIVLFQKRKEKEKMNIFKMHCKLFECFFAGRMLPVVAACWLAAEALGVVAMGVWPAGPEAGLSPFSSGADFRSFLRSAQVSASSWTTPQARVTDEFSLSSQKKTRETGLTSVCVSSSTSSSVRAASCFDLCSKRLTYRIGLDKASITSREQIYGNGKLSGNMNFTIFIWGL